MEDVLEVSTRPSDHRFPRVCLDESATQLSLPRFDGSPLDGSTEVAADPLKQDKVAVPMPVSRMLYECDSLYHEVAPSFMYLCRLLETFTVATNYQPFG
jgi:hypothetical protein